MEQLNNGDFTAIGMMAFVFISSLGFLFAPKPKPTRTESVDEDGPTEIEKPQKVIQEITFLERLHKGLGKTRQKIWVKLEGIVSSGGLTEENIEEIEELLYSSDFGTATVSEIMDHIQEMFKKGDFKTEELKAFLFNFLFDRMYPVQKELDQSLYQFDKKPQGTKVIMVVGVNGAGKTTTIGKLATKLTRQGANVVVGACDTFRAAAVDQLEVWCERAGATMVRAVDGGDPSGVGYEALQTALKEKADYCILDTAGRLHTKSNLMDELKKSKNVLSKLDPSAPHQVLLVIDAITGQNALRQAEEFNKALGLTGLVFTKCDGSSKAGHAVSIVQTLKVPIAYIGVGEHVEDLDIFHLEDYLGALLDYKKINSEVPVSS